MKTIEQPTSETVPSYSVRAILLFKKILLITLTLWLIVTILRFFFIGVSRVNGPSMEPTLKDDDFIIFEKISYYTHPPKRFDIVELINPEHSQFLVKRIIGLPGERVAIKNGFVFISSSTTPEFQLAEPYLKSDTLTTVHNSTEDFSTSLNPHEFFVLGDNRLLSTVDSRSFGAIHDSHIIGRVLKE
jgi:signal peptidase I